MTVVGERLSGELDALAGADLADLDDAALDAEVVSLVRARQRLDAELARRAAAWHTRAVWADDGSRSSSAHLARDGAMSKRSARTIITQGAAVAEMPHVSRAWSTGDIGTEHVVALVRARAHGRDELFARDERMLVEHCRTLLFSHTMQALAYWTQRADAELQADGPPPPPARYVRIRKGYDRTVVGDFALDAIGGATVKKALRRIERRLHRQERRAGVVRSRAERMADALVEMAELANAAPKGARRPAPLVTILAGESSVEHLLELTDGTVLAPGDVVPHITRAMVQSFIFDGADRVMCGSKQRTFRGTLRRAIQVRDRHCQHPSGCDAPIDDCDLDHITPWSRGGETTHEGGRLGCEPHNLKSDLRDRAPAWFLEQARSRREDEARIRQRIDELVALRERPPPTPA